MDNENTCGHKGCGCPVGEDSPYCSDHCTDVAEMDLDEIACDCGHEGCG